MINRWLIKFLGRKSFYIKKCIANKKDDPRINEMVKSVKIEAEELLTVKRV